MNSSWSVSKIDRVLCQFWNIPLLQSHSHRRPDNPKQMRQFVLGQFTLESTFGAYEKKENSLYKPGSMHTSHALSFTSWLRLGEQLRRNFGLTLWKDFPFLTHYIIYNWDKNACLCKSEVFILFFFCRSLYTSINTDLFGQNYSGTAYYGKLYNTWPKSSPVWHFCAKKREIVLTTIINRRRRKKNPFINSFH